MSTIDPGIGQPVQDAAHNVEPDRASEDETYDPDDFRDQQELEDLMAPARWWFASTASPLLAGTFGPIATGFNICALVAKWRVYIPPGGSEAFGLPIQDPPWLIAINAVSLLCAIVGNFSLLLNMAQRIKFSIAQPITISGFLGAGILLIADIAAINASPTYFLTDPQESPDVRHALSGAYYYAIWAAVLYTMIGILMCTTVYGANRGLYDHSFHLTVPQRTLMLQTMMFVSYLLLGALVYSHVEHWQYLDAVYWADVTLLTVGFGDYEPSTATGRGLLFPFAIVGILIVGLVIGSIRSLVLERGQQKLAARITEKRRENAIHNVDEQKQTIRISWLAKADFSTDPSLSSAQRREEEFKIMRKVQRAAERERRWMALTTSLLFALGLWFVGAAIFMVCERKQSWTYFESLYFAFVALLTIGYGDFTPSSNSGRAFFVIWSLLAIPSLTILISNMGDTIVKAFSDLTMWIGYLTVLPGEGGIRSGAKRAFSHLSEESQKMMFRLAPAGLLGDTPFSPDSQKHLGSTEHENHMLDQVAERLESHVQKDELDRARDADAKGDALDRDIHFYHYVLARELRNVQKDLFVSPPKQYSWADWEYYLKLMGNQDDPRDYPGQAHPDILVPAPLRDPAHADERLDHQPSADDRSATAEKPPVPPALEEPRSDSEATVATSDGAVDRPTELREQQEKGAQRTPPQQEKGPQPSQPQQAHSHTRHRPDWSWLSDKSPLMGSKAEAEWICERLSAALERELNRQRRGTRRQPPISMKDALRRRKASGREDRGDRHDSSKGDRTDSDPKHTQGADARRNEKVEDRLGDAAHNAA